MKPALAIRKNRQAPLALALCLWLWGASASSQDCAKTSVNLLPLTDMGTERYQSYEGGLYPNGSNFMPRAHFSAGQALAAQIKPLNQSGGVDVTNGKIVLLSVGMSNATQEFSMFKNIADNDRAKNPMLVIVDGAQGGQTAAIISDSTANFWRVIEQRLSQANVTRQQVQVAWVKEADARPTASFPTHALTLLSEFEKIAGILKSRYPNLKIAYWSSRTYGGYATTNLNPEPYAYESGFAVKWLLEKQINGDSALAFSGNKPKAPWLAWGPYLWADGRKPRSDGLIWECTDFGSDGTHPSAAGRMKVAQFLLNFFKIDSTTTSWFLRNPTTRVDHEPGYLPNYFSLEQNYPNPFPANVTFSNPSTTIRFSLAQREHVTLKVFDALGKEVVTLMDELLNEGEQRVIFDATGLPSGVYFYKLQTPSFSKTRKAVLML